MIFLLTELSSQEKTTLAQLFPRYEEYGLPATQSLPYNELHPTEVQHLKIMLGFSPSSIFFRRGDVIIGYELKKYIAPITTESNGLKMVYDRRSHRLEELTTQEMKILGVDNLIDYVRAIDELDTIHRIQAASISGMNDFSRLTVLRARKEARIIARLQAAYESHCQARRRNQSVEEVVKAIRQAYNETYQETYNDYLIRHQSKRKRK